METPIGASPGASVTVDTLTGTVTTGNIYLNGPNHIAHLGNLGTQAGFTTPSPLNAGVTAAAGNVLIRNDQDLNVVTTVQAGSASPQFAELDVLGGGNLTVLNGGRVTAGDVSLHAGDSATSGNVTVASGGTVFANTDADLSAGVGYTAATPTLAPSHSYARGVASAGSVQIVGYAHAGTPGTLGLYAHGNIDEPGVIQGGVLTGFAGGQANLPGFGSPTANQISNLADFTTNTGFILHDGQALSVIGNGVTDGGPGITIAVAGSGALSGFGATDLALAAPLVATSGTVKLEATGNVYETNGDIGHAGTLTNAAGAFTVTGGVVTAGTLISQSGAIPDTETGGNPPGTIPGVTFGRAIDWFGNANSVATLGNVTATGNFLLHNVQDLSLTGTVMAGTEPSATGTVAASYAVINGPFGTAPTTVPEPFAEIDVGNGGSLTIASGGTLHVGRDGTTTGNAVLLAGDDSTAGNVTVNGDVFAANGGSVTIGSGFNPNTSHYFSTCGSLACSITINGTVWGDSATPSALAGHVTLNAASSIDETLASARIGATTLAGFAGGHVNLSEASFGTPATAVALNQIGTLGAFSSNNFTNDPQGFLLRDGRALTVTGPVHDLGTTTSNISIAVMAGAGTGYSAANLLLQGDITANSSIGAVTLQATGNILQSAGSITTNSFFAEAGAIPGTEATGTQTGTLASAPTLPNVGSIDLPGQNQIRVLGGGGRGVSAEGSIAITNVPSLTIKGPVVSHDGTITLTNTNSVTNQSIVNAMSQDVTITSGGGSIINQDTIEALNNVLLNAALDIGNGRLVAMTGDATLLAGRSITNTGLVLAGNHVYAKSGITVATGSIDNQATIEADGPGTSGSPSISLIALNGGSVGQSATGTTVATANTAFVTIDASANVGLDGAVLATASHGSIDITAGSTFDQSGGTIQAGGAGTSGAPSILITANTGTIGQAAGTIIATNPDGYVALNATASDINTAGTIQATGSAGVVNLTAGNGITQSSGLIEAGGPGATTAGTPSVTLVAQSGTIAQTSAGVIRANNSAGTIDLTASASDISTAGTIQSTGSTGVVHLTAGQSITQSGGLIEAGGSGTTAAGTPTVTLLAQTGTIAQTSTGAIIRANNSGGSIGLTATKSDISTSGSVLAAGTSATVALTAGGSVTQSDGTILSGGAGTAGTPSIAITADAGSIVQNAGTLPSTIIATNSDGYIALNAKTLDIDTAGTIQATGTASVVNLTAKRAINQTNGRIEAGTSGTTTAGTPTVTLLAQTGTIAQTSAGVIQANNSAGTIDLTAAASDISTAGTIQSTGSTGVVNLTAGHAITQTNGLIEAGNSGTTAAGTPSITLLAQTGTIAQASAGVIQANNSAGTIGLTAANAGITTAGTIIAPGSSAMVGLNAHTSILQTGGTILSGGAGTIAASGAATSNLTMVAQTGSIVQDAGALIKASNTSGVIGLHAAGDINFAGSLLAPGTLDNGIVPASMITAGISLASTGGAVSEDPAHGVLEAGMLVGSAGKSVALTGADNRVGNLGAFTAQGGDFVMTDDQSLAVTGAVASNTGSVVITGTHLAGGGASSLTNAATAAIQGQTGVTLTADSGLTNNGSVASSTNDVVTTAGGTLTNNGLISAAHDASLTAGGAIDNSQAGRITAGHFAVLTAGGSINDSGAIAAAGAGSSAAPSLVMTAQAGTIAESTTGTIQATNAGGVLRLTADNGSIVANGIVQTPTLTGSAASAATILPQGSATNQIATLGSFQVSAADGALRLNDDRDLRIDGPLAAHTIAINVGSHAITLNSGTVIHTGGQGRPYGTIQATALPTDQLPDGGAYLTAGSFRQLGVSTVGTLPGHAGSILRIDAAAGPISFSGSDGNGLNGTDTWLILNTSGTITGRINVKSLDVAYGGITGGAELTGLVNGFTGQTAAGQGNIEPAKSARYRMNSCPIHSVSCVLLPTEGVPTANPLDEIFLGSFFNPQDEGDLLLPIVSDQDY